MSKFLTRPALMGSMSGILAATLSCREDADTPAYIEHAGATCFVDDGSGIGIAGGKPEETKSVTLSASGTGEDYKADSVFSGMRDTKEGRDMIGSDGIGTSTIRCGLDNGQYRLTPAFHAGKGVGGRKCVVQRSRILLPESIPKQSFFREFSLEFSR